MNPENLRANLPEEYQNLSSAQLLEALEHLAKNGNVDLTSKGGESFPRTQPNPEAPEWSFSSENRNALGKRPLIDDDRREEDLDGRASALIGENDNFGRRTFASQNGKKPPIEDDFRERPKRPLKLEEFENFEELSPTDENDEYGEIKCMRINEFFFDLKRLTHFQPNLLSTPPPRIKNHEVDPSTIVKSMIRKSFSGRRQTPTRILKIGVVHQLRISAWKT